MNTVIRMLLQGLFGVLAAVAQAQAQPGGTAAAGYDADQALAVSQATLGTPLEDLQFTDAQGQAVRLKQYRDRPVLLSLIFTSCYHVCPAITRHLHTAVEAAREALGQDSFQVLTLGFDTANDTPEAMRAFARAQKIDDPNWAFLSADAETMAKLVANLGFSHFPSPRGFDHINQVTVVDRDGLIYAQVYGAAFELPALVEPLKELVYNRPRPGSHFASGLVDRVKLFCTVYDPTTGRYRFDYSLFVGIAVGAIAVLGVAAWLLLEVRRARRVRRTGAR